MNRKEFNSSSDKLHLIQDDFTNIQYDETYDVNLYEEALKLFYNSDMFLNMNKEQQQSIKNFFDMIQQNMHEQQIPRKFKLPDKFYMDIWKNAIRRITYIDLEQSKGSWSFEEIYSEITTELEFVQKSDNKFDEKMASLLWDIYQREDLSIGIHGTTLPDSFDISEDNCDFFKHGIMVDSKYKTGDARRTVNFQDLPGKQWGFGYISFLDLMNYQYESRNKNNSSMESKSNYSVIVVRPSKMKKTSFDENCPDEYSIVTNSTTIMTNDGHYLSGHLVKPEFILGIIKNNEIFVKNPKCDLDKLSKLNEPINERNKAIDNEKMTKKLTEETQTVTGQNKRGMIRKLKELFQKHKNRDNEQNREK